MQYIILKYPMLLEYIAALEEFHQFPVWPCNSSTRLHCGNLEPCRLRVGDLFLWPRGDAVDDAADFRSEVPAENELISCEKRLCSGWTRTVFERVAGR